MQGKAITDYASLSGKIHTLVIDKTLSISGAAADAKAVRDALDNINAVSVDTMQEMVDEAIKDAAILSTDDCLEAVRKETLTASEIAAICV